MSTKHVNSRPRVLDSDDELDVEKTVWEQDDSADEDYEPAGKGKEVAKSTVIEISDEQEEENQLLARTDTATVENKLQGARRKRGLTTTTTVS